MKSGTRNMLFIAGIVAFSAILYVCVKGFDEIQDIIIMNYRSLKRS
ncbi:hypothetical protein [Paraliobacillus ryukyuensis]|nr:hypothetical protein [Paraliobacillus ryukyuensis]